MTRFGEKARPMLPKGVATFLPEATSRKRHVEESILSVFRLWGYQEVITPLFEYLDVIGPGLGEGLIEKGYKFVDRSNGRLMLIRPDVTAQIARMVAMLMEDRPRPLRLCYRANVFRHEEEHAGRAREVFQIGGELVGPDGPQADAEMVALAIESLLSLGLSDFKVALGHSAYFRGLLGRLNLPLPIKGRINQAMVRKDTGQLRGILGTLRIADADRNALMEMPRLFGGEEAIDRAEALSADPNCREALNRLREICGILKASGWSDYLLVDLSEVRGFDYYTGMVFEVFVKNLGVPVGRGGRYDQLIGRFGKSSPSTGFAFDIEHVQSAWQEGRAAGEDDNLKRTLRAADWLLVERGADPDRLFRIARSGRKNGLRVVQQAGGMNLKEAVRYATDSQIAAVALLEGPDKVTVADVETGKTEKMSLKAFLPRLSGNRPVRRARKRAKR
jgi:ATP phosphoribosyltransferase regulatory subunit